MRAQVTTCSVGAARVAPFRPRLPTLRILEKMDAGKNAANIADGLFIFCRVQCFWIVGKDAAREPAPLHQRWSSGNPHSSTACVSAVNGSPILLETGRRSFQPTRVLSHDRQQ